MTAPSPTADQLLVHTDWLLQLARALVGDAAAPDVVQQTFEVALAKPPKHEGPLRPWLGGVARNLAKMTLRGRARRERREQALPAPVDAPSSDTLVERARTQQAVAAIVLELPAPLRDVLLLRFFEGMTAAEIARAQGIPAATVRSRLAEALARVREALDQQHGGDRRQWVALVAPLPIAGPTTGPGVALVGGILVKTGLKIVIAVVVLAVAALVAGRQLGWFGAADPPTAPAVAGGGGVAKPSPPTAPAPTTSPGAARTPALAHDDDPAGTIRLEGQVIDVHDRPVGGATVAIDANPTKLVVTEADGSFVFEGLIARDYRLEATVQGGDTNQYAGPARLRLAPNPEPVTLRMREGGVVEVVVTAAGDGAAVAGAIVELRSTLVWTGTTNREGVATLRGVGAAWAPLVARATGFAPSAIMLSTTGTPAAPARVALTLTRGAALAGRVVDDGGKPVRGARVVATATSEPFPVVDARRDGVESQPDGSFTFPVVASGTWRLTATHDGLAPTTSAPITVDGAHDKRGVELVLARGATIDGIVKDARGAPVAAAEVRVVVRGHTFWRAQRQAFTAADGTFAITGLPRRAVDVVAAHGVGSSAIIAADLAAQPTQSLVLSLALTDAIEGTVVDTTGRPVGDAQVITEPVWSGGIEDRAAWIVRGPQETVTDQAGRFRFVGVPTGAYRVRAAHPGAPESAIELAPAVATRSGGPALRIVLAADGSITGKVALADGTAPAAFTVAIGGTHPMPFATADGRFVLHAVAGTHTLVVDGRRFLSSKTTAVTVVPGQAADVGTITVQPGRSVSGRVLDEHHAPVANAQVAVGALLTGGGAELYIPSESLGAKDATTDAQGRFTLEGFPPAPLTIVAGKDGLRAASIRLPGGEESARVELVLANTASLEGTITREGKPLADTIVIANPVGATRSNFFVTTGPDGTFALDALAPGPYVVYPMIGGGGPKPKDMYIQKVEVAATGRTRVTIDASPGPTTVTIAVKTDAGPAAPMAMVFLIAAAVAPTTSDDLGALDQLGVFGDVPVALYMRGAIGAPAEVAGVRRGTHTACAMPPPGDARKDIRCVPLNVGGQARQTLTLVVPATWYEPASP